MREKPSTEPEEKALAAKEAELQAALGTIKAAFRVLGAKALAMIGLLAAVAAFGWAVWDPTGWRVGAACLFAVLVFWPALWFSRG